MVDGEIVACVSEERFTRRKNDEAYPKTAIDYVLARAGVSARELDYVTVAGRWLETRTVLHRMYSGWSVRDSLREQHEYWRPRMYEKRKPNFFDIFKDKLDLSQYPGSWDEVLAFYRDGRYTVAQETAFHQELVRRLLATQLGVDSSKVIFTHHHRSHAYYAYYASPMPKDRTLVLTADAWGDDMNASVSVAEGPNINLISSSGNCNLGRIYRYVTLLLGMKPHEHEYKVMGLAAYSSPKYYQEPLKVFHDTMYVDGLGFNYHEVPTDLYFYFRDRLEGYRFDAIAGALQRYTEDILVEWVRNCLNTAGTRRLCFGGGVAMNIKAVMEIAKLDELKELFICPSPADESLAIGSAYVLMHDKCLEQGLDPRQVLRPLQDAYLGPALACGEVKAVIQNFARDGRYIVREEVGPARVAAAIASGKIVGRCVGRSEFGARSLGNRAILADPRDIRVIRRINEKIKCRDFWMPFAPSMIEERAGDYVLNPKGLRAPYMTVAFETTPLARKDLPAALHQADLTCRPQIVERALNPQYHALISEFERLTGVGALLNTSFNIHGEPIVQTAADAADVLHRSGLDALILDGYFIEKRALESSAAAMSAQVGAEASAALAATGV